MTLYMVLRHVAIALLAVGCSQGRPFVSNHRMIRDVQVDFIAVDYLKTYGWVSATEPIESMFGETNDSPLIQMQTFFGLKPTGMLDDATIAFMLQPRCGRADVFKRNNRIERSTMTQPNYDQLDYRQTKKNVEYKFSNYWDGRSDWNGQGLPNNYQQDAVKRAAKTWNDVINLNFSEATGISTDVSVAFYPSGASHPGDNTPLSGVQFAHAWSNSIHFNWNADWTRPLRLEGVALHEFGHVLGLGHSGDSHDVMFPNYTQVLHLSQRDLTAIWSLYDRRRSAPTNPKPCPGPKCTNGTCLEASKKCDGVYDCMDMSDETNCSINAVLCQDQHPKCAQWKNNGGCTDNAMFMNIACQRTCQKCSLGSIEFCQDHSVFCQQWQNDGECRKNPNYMTVICRKSCNECEESFVEDGSPTFYEIENMPRSPPVPVVVAI